MVAVVDGCGNCMPGVVDVVLVEGTAEIVAIVIADIGATETVGTVDTAGSVDTGTAQVADNAALAAPCLKSIETCSSPTTNLTLGGSSAEISIRGVLPG